MNEMPELTDAQLDRLVDGELGAAEYKQLLRGLDQRPGDWKRVALAFLEAQAWRGELAAAIAPPKPVIVRPAKAARVPWELSLVAVALVLLAFVSGTFFGRGSQSNAINPTTVVQNKPIQPEAGTTRVVAKKPIVAGSMHLRLPGKGEEEQIVEVPLFEKDSVNLRELWSSPDSPADEYIAAAEQRGEKVVREWELIPVSLQDGREAVFPVERVKPVKTKSFVY